MKKRFIKSFEEVAEFDVIINCTGLGSYELAGDEKVHAIRGQVTRVDTS